MNPGESGRPTRGDLSKLDLNKLRDIAPVLAEWDYEAGTLSVRKIVGLDGRPKLQMRLDLGVMQMEIDGRPDGTRPFGHESLLDYHEARLQRHKREHETAETFKVSSKACAKLREEARQYYHRYLGSYALGEYASVLRDTARNLRLLDFCQAYGERGRDRGLLEQYRPYILMMNTRAAVALQMQDGKTAEAYQTVRRGLREIKRFFKRMRDLEGYPHCVEVRTLRQLAKQLRSKLPVDPAVSLKRRLDAAIEREAYEEAARIRDELAKLESDASAA